MGEWERELQMFVQVEEHRWKEINRSLTSVEDWTKWVLENVQKAKNLADEQERRFRADIDKLIGMRDDPVVVVRRQGWTSRKNPPRIHADDDCGWAPDSDDAVPMLLSRARDRGWEPCTACGDRIGKGR